MEKFLADVAIVGAGGAGLRAAIAVAEADPTLRIALISKVYPMRSHTVAAEGGAAAVTQAHDSLEAHFHDTEHPVMRSFETGEAWRWCYVDERLG